MVSLPNGALDQFNRPRQPGQSFSDAFLAQERDLKALPA
jgi:hypothetical protein